MTNGKTVIFFIGKFQEQGEPDKVLNAIIVENNPLDNDDVFDGSGEIVLEDVTTDNSSDALATFVQATNTSIIDKVQSVFSRRFRSKYKYNRDFKKYFTPT